MSISQQQAVNAFVAPFNAAPAAEPNDALKPFWIDAMRINTRKFDLDKIPPLSVPGSYMPALVRQNLGVDLARFQVLVTKWTPGPTPRPAATDIPNDVQEMDQLFGRINQVWRLYFQKLRVDLQKDVARVDNRIVPNSQLWDNLFADQSLRDLSRADFVTAIGDKITAWRRPRLRDWFAAMQYPAVANGRIRLEALNQVRGYDTHLTNYLANVDATASINDPIATVMDALMPPAGADWRGLHVTMELFGQDDDRNPKFFKGQGFYTTQAANQMLQGLQGGINGVRGALQAELNAALQTYQGRVQILINARLACLV